MALPPGFLDELRGRTSLARVAARKLTWDARKTNAAKGDYWAACPFHQEKTASFHVDDRKGFYYCFGCHAKGDAIGFVKETENVGFMEAVAILAREAGMAIPAPDPAAQARADRRATLSDVMEEAVRFFRLQLKTGAARAARDYLTGRGLTDAALTRFEIGFAPDARQALWQHLTAKGIAPDSVVEAGLAARPDDGGPPYDRFRGRIQFPIRDARGRTIAFGGRALSETARAKYLNSPETPLFDKGRTLYHHGPAREAAGKGASLIVAEGYMDVIALVEAGFTGAVAPLGTAITEAQLDLLWRIAPEPIVALDGDTAGRRAAHRLVDLALPRLEPGRSLRFALLPAGQDPDDVIRAGGPTAMQQVLDRSETLVQTLINRETEGRDLRHAEARAEVNAALRGAAQKITHRDLRDQFWSEIKPVLAQIFDAARPARAGNRRRQRARMAGFPGGSRPPRPPPPPSGRPSPWQRATKTSKGCAKRRSWRCAWPGPTWPMPPPNGSKRSIASRRTTQRCWPRSCATPHQRRATPKSWALRSCAIAAHVPLKTCARLAICAWCRPCCPAPTGRWRGARSTTRFPALSPGGAPGTRSTMPSRMPTTSPARA